jgi:hypothetical protein
MLYREIIAVCSEIHTKHINTVCGQNVELLNVKLAVHIVTTVVTIQRSSADPCYVVNTSCCTVTPVNDPLTAGDNAQDHPHMYAINIITHSSPRVCLLTSPFPGLCFSKCPRHADRQTRMLLDTTLGFARDCTVYLTRYTQVHQQPGSSVSIVA